MTEKEFSLEDYIHAATRQNTRRSYQAAIEHFEVSWGGMLPATADQVARYLVDHAGRLAHNTLKLRLAALSQWHVNQGFVDPTRDPVIRKVLRGIRELHPAREKQARPLQLEALGKVVAALEQPQQTSGNPAEQLRRARDRALLLVGFWRGFRTDELTRMQIEHVDVVTGEGMRIYLPRSKTDEGQGREYRAPALQRLCPVQAFLDWLHISGLQTGPVFRAISSAGQLSGKAMSPGSLAPVIRKRLAEAGIADSDAYSGHSLRRGFATWAASNGWSQAQLMKYVGWADPRSAARYIESAPELFFSTIQE